MGVLKSIFKGSFFLILFAASVLGVLYFIVPKRFEFVWERRKLHPWLLSPIIRYRQDCKSPERVPTENCSCPYGYFDDGVSDECQICPYPANKCHSSIPNQETCDNDVYISFDKFLPEGLIEELDDFLINEMDIYNNTKHKGNFYARGKVHGGAIAFTKQTKSTDLRFKEQRVLKMSNIYHEITEQGKMYQKVYDLLDQMDIFEFCGEAAIIISPPGHSGIMHRDHIYLDHLSEFIWIRGNRLKQFHVWDPEEKHFQHFTSYTGFFDDTEEHNTFEIPEYSYSIRINGKFKPHIRQYIADNYQFIHKEFRRQVLLDNEVNIKQDYSDDPRFRLEDS